jgi:hypothetical protein
MCDANPTFAVPCGTVRAQAGGPVVDNHPIELSDSPHDGLRSAPGLAGGRAVIERLSSQTSRLAGCPMVVDMEQVLLGQQPVESGLVDPADQDGLFPAGPGQLLARVDAEVTTYSTPMARKARTLTFRRTATSPYAVRGWNISTGLPDGSSTRT